MIVRAAPTAKHAPNGPTPWLVTFIDLMALMLAFFVMAYAMSASFSGGPDSPGMSASVPETPAGGEAVSGPDAQPSLPRLSYDRGLGLDYLARLFADRIASQPSLSGLQIIRGPDHLVLALPERILFARGAYRINPESGPAVRLLAELLSRIRNRVELVGHSDPAPVRQAGSYRSNWDLSLLRAAELGDALAAAGYRKNMTVRGAGDGRYADLDPALPDAVRSDLSRRVDIVILDDNGTRIRRFGFPAD